MTETTNNLSNEFLTFNDIKKQIIELVTNRASNTKQQIKPRSALNSGVDYVNNQLTQYLENTESSFDLINILGQLFNVLIKKETNDPSGPFANIINTQSNNLVSIIFPINLITGGQNNNLEHRYILDEATNLVLMQAIRGSVHEYFQLDAQEPNLKEVIEHETPISRELLEEITHILGISFAHEKGFLNALHLKTINKNKLDIQDLIALYKIHLLTNATISNEFELESIYDPNDSNALLGENQRYSINLGTINTAKGIPSYLHIITNPQNRTEYVGEKVLQIKTDNASLSAIEKSPVASIIYKRFITAGKRRSSLF